MEKKDCVAKIERDLLLHSHAFIANGKIVDPKDVTLLQNNNKKYLIISDDGSIFKTNTLTDDDRQACEDGYLEIIDIESKKYTVDGSIWTEIQEWRIKD